MIKVNLWRGNGRDLTTRKMGTLSRLSELRVLCTTTVRSMMFRLLMDIILEKLSFRAMSSNLFRMNVSRTLIAPH